MSKSVKYDTSIILITPFLQTNEPYTPALSDTSSDEYKRLADEIKNNLLPALQKTAGKLNGSIKNIIITFLAPKSARRRRSSESNTLLKIEIEILTSSTDSIDQKVLETEVGNDITSTQNDVLAEGVYVSVSSTKKSISNPEVPLTPPDCPKHWSYDPSVSKCYIERSWYPFGITQKIANHACKGFKRNLSFRDIDKTQNLIGSTLFQPRNEVENEFMKNNFGKLRIPYTSVKADCFYAWVGIQKIRNQWVSSSNFENIISYSNWKTEDESSKEGFNFAVMDSDGFWIASKNTPQEDSGCQYYTRKSYNVLCVL